jgi:transcriptional regulator with XRE-family HTH domain
MIMEQLLTTEELAKRMRVNPSTVRRWRLDDVGPSLSPCRHGLPLSG